MLKIKKVSILLLILSVFVCGCSLFEEEINNNSEIAFAVDTMINDLDNFSYDVYMIMESSIIDIEVELTCKEDRSNEAGSCVNESFGVAETTYYDYSKGVMYSTYSTFLGDSGEWTTVNTGDTETNEWLLLGDYIFDLSGVSIDGGILYTGVIDNEKLAESMSSASSDVDTTGLVSGDIEIEVFVNSDGYVETLEYELELLGETTRVEVSFYNYNTSGSINIEEETN